MVYLSHPYMANGKTLALTPMDSIIFEVQVIPWVPWNLAKYLR